MKLVEIKNIKPKQIYKHKNGNIYIVSYQTHYRYEIADCYKNNMLDSEENEFYSREFAEDMELIGFVNITHKIEDNKLVEIPREEFEVDDIFVYTECDGLQSYYSLHQITKDGEFLLISDNDDKVLSGVCADNLLDNGLLKCGILGVNYEWVNDKLIKE